MNQTLNEIMRDATRLTRGGQLQEATALLQRFLGGQAQMPPTSAFEANRHPGGEVIDGCVFELESTPESAKPQAPAAGDEFIAGVFTHASLTRRYKLYVPPGAPQGRPLLVMLHGCTQNPDDFAAGTAMNELARQQGFYVLYPAQSQEANSSRCWNWFKHNHQQRGRGEPALIAALTESLVWERQLDASRVFVAGLSAGGAMAAILGAAYPDVYAAVGVHSGLAPGVATNVGEALAAMNGTGTKRKGPPMSVPTIVFHGDQDRTVTPANGIEVIQARVGASAGTQKVESGVRAQGKRFTRQIHRDGSGEVQAEHWLIHGAGHAWSGGKPAGSYTDPTGPDASREMLRFFLEHPKR